MGVIVLALVASLATSCFSLEQRRSWSHLQNEKESSVEPGLSKFYDYLPGLLGAKGAMPDAWEGSFRPKQLEQYHNYLTKWAKDDMIKETVCETGFGKGISALFWLSVLPKATLHTFDREFPKHATDFLHKVFGQKRLILHVGDTNQTLRTFKTKCDVVSMDGDRSEGAFYNEIELLRKSSHYYTSLLSDDTFWVEKFKDPCTEDCLSCNCTARGFANHVSKEWYRRAGEDVIQTLECTSLDEVDKQGQALGYCLGRFLGTEPVCKEKGVRCLFRKHVAHPIYCSYSGLIRHWHC